MILPKRVGYLRCRKCGKQLRVSEKQKKEGSIKCPNCRKSNSVPEDFVPAPRPKV